MEKNESSTGRQSTPSKSKRVVTQQQFGKNPLSTGLATHLGSSQHSLYSVPKQNLASIIEHHSSGRRSLSELSLIDHNPVSGNVSLRKQFHHEEECNTAVKIPKGSEEENSVPQVSVETSPFHIFYQ